MAHRLEKKNLRDHDFRGVMSPRNRLQKCNMHIYIAYAIYIIHMYGYNKVIKTFTRGKYDMNGLMWTFRLSWLSFRHIS